MTNNNMTFEINTGSYNERRYGRPWIAKVTFDNSGKGTFEWGTWVGRMGEAGTLVIDAAEGEIVAQGQKDNRGGSTESSYYQVRNGELVKLASKAEAYKAAREYVAPVVEQVAAPAVDLTGMSLDELNALLVAVQAEIANRPPLIRRDTNE